MVLAIENAVDIGGVLCRVMVVQYSAEALWSPTQLVPREVVAAQ